MDFCIQYWDPRHTGLIEEPHHNTYDIEFWGPDGLCSQLSTWARWQRMSDLARDAGHPEDAAFYDELAEEAHMEIEDLVQRGILPAGDHGERPARPLLANPGRACRR